jgi:thymidine kinase
MITLVFGPMFSGKTSFLLAYERRFLIAQKKVLFVKWEDDNRYHDSKVMTHDGQSNKCDVVKAKLLFDIPSELYESHDCIMVDEAQFYNDLLDWCKKYGRYKHIILAALSGDYKQESFKPITEIISLCDDIQHIKSICTKCGKDAPFTIRTTCEKEQTVIGAEDKYQPRCGECL